MTIPEQQRFPLGVYWIVGYLMDSPSEEVQQELREAVTRAAAKGYELPIGLLDFIEGDVVITSTRTTAYPATD